MVVVLLVAGLLVWAGASLIISAVYERRSRPSLEDRLRRFHPTLGDEAEQWLRRR